MWSRWSFFRRSATDMLGRLGDARAPFGSQELCQRRTYTIKIYVVNDGKNLIPDVIQEMTLKRAHLEICTENHDVSAESC